MPDEASHLLGASWIPNFGNLVPLHIIVGHGIANGTLPAQDRVDTIVNGRRDTLICIRVSIDPELSPPIDILGRNILELIT